MEDIPDAGPEYSIDPFNTDEELPGKAFVLPGSDNDRAGLVLPAPSAPPLPDWEEHVVGEVIKKQLPAAAAAAGPNGKGGRGGPKFSVETKQNFDANVGCGGSLLGWISLNLKCVLKKGKGSKIVSA